MAAVYLYEAGKVSCILISSNNSTVAYSEQELMQKHLVAAGVSKDDIYLDYAALEYGIQ